MPVMAPATHDERKCDDREQTNRPCARWQKMRDGVEMMDRAEGGRAAMMGTMMPVLSRSWHGSLYRLKYQSSQPTSQAGPRDEGADTDGSHLVCFAGRGLVRRG